MQRFSTCSAVKEDRVMNVESNLRSRPRNILTIGAALVFCIALHSMAVANTTARQNAARLNNIGTALMSQQLLQRAADKFDEAYKADPSLPLAEMNKGLALLYLQKLPEAKLALEHSAQQDPNDPHTWYVLGLLYRSENQLQPGI